MSTKQNTIPATRAIVWTTAGLFAATLVFGLHITARADAPVSARVRASQSAVMTGSDGRVQLELLLKGEERTFGPESRKPTDFLVVLDRSGSMEGDKIEHGRAAIRELVSRLREDDRFGLVAYASNASVVFPLERATREAQARWSGAVSTIHVGGGTNMSKGLDVAATATSWSGDRAVRVILISDGLANEGDASPGGLARRASRFGERGQSLTTIGVGLDFNEYLMGALADQGTGNYYFLEKTAELAEVFASELSAAQETVARNVRVTLTPEAGSGVEVLEAAGYPLVRDGSTVSFQPGALFSGQERRVWITYRLPTETTGHRSLGSVEVSYEADGRRASIDIDEPVTIALVEDEARFFASVDRDAYKDAVLNESYGRLKQSVAEAVREGNLERAREEIQSYRTVQERMQDALQIGELETNLGDVEKLERDVVEAISAGEPAQNRFSKMNQADANDMRRAGSKKERSP